MVVKGTTCERSSSLSIKKKNSYFIFSLVTTTKRALHGVAALNSYLSPYNNAGSRFFGALHNKTAAPHAESRGNLRQDLRESLKNTGKYLRYWSGCVGVCVCVLVHLEADDKIHFIVATNNCVQQNWAYVQSRYLY